ncbi:ATP-binding protein [Flavobacterium sp. Fl-77]|uniref:ATP-binding protein n=1 Tax=Flavobacterium flavipigmentatum TaxID=2893884 RepID=A0AAJ2SAX1_9FLAO|nr:MULTISPECIES: tetratricopeptide repeat-containing sensor histidine kinase [unclassified Flavobacterium]MDX6183164.1 ATP-binding protein [Flavobacterium sp. Fl-33]MDX6186767.1 ATP-binding protein [Flavobacterium sp. Fl-77]UFH40421.1 ATP-binding protein [Flavobacterium sp. F-70]
MFFSCKKTALTSSKIKTTLSFDNNHLESKKKEKYLDSIFNVLRVQENDSVIRNFYFKLSTEYYYNNNLKKSLNVSLLVLKLSRQVNDKEGMAKAFYYIGDSYGSVKKDSAYFYYLQAEKLYYKLSDYSNMARMLFNKAYVLFYDGNYTECEVEISKALHYLRDSKDQRLIYSCNTLMGTCLEKLANYDKALWYHQQALNNLEKMKITGIDKDEENNYYIASSINICNLYDLKGEYSKSIAKLQGLLSNNLEEKWPRLYANVLSNLAYSKMKNGDYRNVYAMFSKSLEILKNNGNESDILYKKIHIGEYFLTQKDTFRAINILKEANVLANRIKNSNEILTSLKLLYTLDKKNSFYYANEYINLSDSINIVQKNAHNKYARIEYETSRIQDENKILTTKNFYILTISFALVFLLLIIVILRYSKYKNKELQFLKKQKSANEEIYLLLMEQHEKINNAKENEKSKIAKELHDGIMNRIYGVRMNLGFFNSKVENEIIEKRKEYIFELQNIENEIRTISHDLSRNSFLDCNDFNILLSTLVENQNVTGNTQFTYLIDENLEWSIIQNVYKINLYRIIQEATLNVNKYAGALNCEVKIQSEKNGLLKMSIIDDGQGFDIKSKKEGIGLSNMRERANSLKGYFNIESEIGKGTKIEVIFNLEELT